MLQILRTQRLLPRRVLRLMSRPSLAKPEHDADTALGNLGLRSVSQRNIATLGSLRAMKSPLPMDHLALNDVRYRPISSHVPAHKPRKHMTLTFPDADSLEPVEASKRLAARRAVEDHFPEDAKVIGIGSGSTVIYAVERILEMDNTDSITFISTGFQSKELINGGGLRLGEIDAHPFIDVAFDGADEVDSDLQCIKGGGACLFQEKLVASCAAKFIIVADYRKNSSRLGEKWHQGIPIEIVPLAHAKVIRDLINLGAERPALRMGGKAKAGPVITDNGNFIIDAPFKEGALSPVELLNAIKALCGVVECGLFVNMAEVAYFGNEDGSVDVRYANGKTEHVQAKSKPVDIGKSDERRGSASQNSSQPGTREHGWREYDRFELRR